MVKIVCNLKGPLLCTLGKAGLIDAVLLVPRRYDLPEGSDCPGLYVLPRFFEADFKEQRIRPSELSELHNMHCFVMDYRVLPDVPLNHKLSLVQYDTYLADSNGFGIHVAPLQSSDIQALNELINLLESYSFDYIVGLPYRVFVGKTGELFAIIEEIKSRGLEYHLLGFNPVKWPLRIFKEAHSFDSQAILSYAKRFPSLFLARKSGSWLELDGRRQGLLPLRLETRILIFYEQLRSWLALEPENHSLEHFLELEV